MVSLVKQDAAMIELFTFPTSTEIRCYIYKPFESRVLFVKCCHVIASAGESAKAEISSHSAVDDVITADEQMSHFAVVAFICLGHSTLSLKNTAHRSA